MIPADAGAGGTSDDGGAGGAGGEPDPGPPPAGDTCAEAVDVNELGTVRDGSLLISGTNVAARDDLTPCDASGPPLADVVYRYTAPATGGLRWALGRNTPTLFLVDVRRACSDVASNVVCDDCGGISCGQSLEVTAGDTLYFVIFGLRTTNSPEGTGSFELVLELTPDPGPGEACVSPYESGRTCLEDTVCQGEIGEEPVCGELVCGDGLLSFDPLECDDGNEISGDGCSAECMADAQGPGGDSCAAPATLNLPATRLIFGDGVLHYALAQGSFVAGSDDEASCGTAAGPEAVYEFELAEAGHVEIAAENTEVLSVRAAGETDCGSEEVACQSGLPEAPLELALDLEAGRYAVILDREEPTQAQNDDYTLSVVVDPPQ